jgi:spermidine synthase
MAFHERARTAANIGLGSGLTTHVLLTNPNLQAVDTVEIEPAVVEGAKAFGKRVERVYKDPRSHIHIEDAKTFFYNRKEKYDLIVSEPSNPWVSGVSGRFSNDSSFYKG